MKKFLKLSGDPNKLTVVLSIFLDEIIPEYADPNFEYEVYIPLTGGPTSIWRPAKSKMISEDTLQITRLPDLDYKEIRNISVDDITFKKEDIYKYQSEIGVGDKIKVELVETFMGVTLTAIK